MKFNEIVFVLLKILVGTVITKLVVGTFVAVISIYVRLTVAPFKPTTGAVEPPLGLVILA